MTRSGNEDGLVPTVRLAAPAARSYARGMRAVLLASALLALRSTFLLAQAPVPRVSLGIGVDTTVADVGVLVGLVRDYLARPDSTARGRGLWSEADPLDRRLGDVAGFYAYQGLPATIAGIVASGGDSLYVVQLLHAYADSAGNVSPIAMQRLYAIRAPGSPYGWRLGGALPRHARNWPTRTHGRITFHYAPGRTPDDKHATHAARFVDSVATLFGTAAPERIEYYVAASPDEYFRAAGLDYSVLPSGPLSAKGGNSQPARALVLSGDPAQGEAYLHELAHIVLGRDFRGGVLGEGVAVWLGGSMGRPLPELFRLLASYQRDNPGVMVEALVRGDAGWDVAESNAMNFTGALFIDAVHRRAGAAGLRALAGTPADADAVLAAMRTRLGLSASDPAALDAWWRRAARESAGR
jgi:hypothetical protein